MLSCSSYMYPDCPQAPKRTSTECSTLAICCIRSMSVPPFCRAGVPSGLCSGPRIANTGVIVPNSRNDTSAPRRDRKYVHPRPAARRRPRARPACDAALGTGYLVHVSKDTAAGRGTAARCSVPKPDRKKRNPEP